MATYQLAWLVFAILCSVAGLIGVAWYRSGRLPAQETWGRRLFLLTLLGSGGGSLVTALRPSVSLPYLGIAFAGLVIAMVWEGPRPAAEPRT